MTLKAFIRENRVELDRIIKGALERPNAEGKFCAAPDRFNDAERRLWILNDEGLYRWARSEGVRI